MTRIYLDNCCLSRLFDESEQDRIRSEAEAIRAIFDLIRADQVTWVSSEALADECGQNSDLDIRLLSESLLTHVGVEVNLDSYGLAKVEKLELAGMGFYDAVHLVSAAKGHCEALLTTDDKFIKKAARMNAALDIDVVVMNPVDWVRRRNHDNT